MADISAELAAIKSAVYGEEVRDSIHDGLQKMNNELGTAIGTQVIDRASVDAIINSSLSHGWIGEALKMTALSENASLNSVTTPGTYKCISDAVASTITNKPSGVTGEFVLIVINAGLSAYAVQILIPAFDGEMYTRSYRRSNWTTWTESIRNNTDDIAALKTKTNRTLIGDASNMTVIEDNTDLNSITTPGTYKQISYDTSTSIQNSPIDFKSEFTLLVINSPYTSYVCQIFIPAYTGAIYSRTLYRNIWRNWNSYVTGSDIETIESSVQNVEGSIQNIDLASTYLSYGDKNVIDYSAITSGKRINANNGEISDAGSVSISDYIPVRHGTKIKLSFALGSASYGMAFYDATQEFISGLVQGSSQTQFVPPEGSAYVRITIPNTELTPGSETATAYLTNDLIMSLYDEAQRAKEYYPIVKKTKWLAFGDSITCGVYSVAGGSNVHEVTNEGWVPKLANALGYELTKIGSCGMGYTASISGRLPETPAASSPRINMSDLLTRIEAMTDDFNLITVAFGTNDYGTINGVTIDTIKAGCTSCLERITTKFPKARVVCITPFNIYGRKVDSVLTPYGTKNGTQESGVEKENWQDAGKFAYGYTYGSKKLKNVADAIKECCESLGVECIYATDGFVFNSNNISSLLLDGTHPSLDGHDLIAKSMAHYLMY